MRVLITPEWYPWPDRPGFGSFCRDQAVLASRAHDVVVVTWSRAEGLHRPYEVSEACEDGLRTFRLRFADGSKFKVAVGCKVLGVLAVMRRLQREGWRPDVIHAHEYTAGRPAFTAAAIAGAPVVVSEHASDFALGRLTDAQLARARRCFNSAAMICPVSRDLARRVAPLAGNTPVVEVPNSIDTSLFRPTARCERSAVRLLSVGNLVTVKGHSHLLDAMRLVLDAGYSPLLDVVGDGPLRPELERQAARLGLRASIEFHGFVPRERVAAMMQEADVFVLPSLWENMPCALLEAMASGLPSVATRVGGTAEILDDSSGVIVEPRSPRALAAGIAEVLRKRAAYDSRHMYECAVRRYGGAAIGRRWSEIYHQVQVHGQHRRNAQPDAVKDAIHV